MADVHGSTVTASVLALPDFFTSHASTERVLTSVLEDTRGARGEEIRHPLGMANIGRMRAVVGVAQLLGRSSIS